MFQGVISLITWRSGSELWIYGIIIRRVPPTKFNKHGSVNQCTSILNRTPPYAYSQLLVCAMDSPTWQANASLKTIRVFCSCKHPILGYTYKKIFCLNIHYTSEKSLNWGKTSICVVLKNTTLSITSY